MEGSERADVHSVDEWLSIPLPHRTCGPGAHWLLSPATAGLITSG